MPGERKAADGQMLARALRFYSDHCETGNLHPHCPYAVPTRDGLGCGEECLDYLAAHQDDEGSREHADLRFIRIQTTRRARRGPDPEAPAYDCRQVRIEEDGLPSERQSPTTLLLQLADALVEPPHTVDANEADRQVTVRSLVDELRRRGFDVERLVTAAIVPVMAQSVVSWAVVTAVTGGQLPSGWTYHERSKWVRMLLQGFGFGFPEKTQAATDAEDGESTGLVKFTVADPKVAKLVSQMVTIGVGKIRAWMTAQSIEALLAWKTPTPEEFDEIIIPPTGPTEDTLQRWMFERFTSTYLESWAMSSLQHEWQYLHGRQTPPCNAGQLGLRRIDARQLAVVIADRTTSDRGDRSDALTISKYVGVAAELLASGQRDAAVQIFDMACSLSPGSGEALNNRGFCRLPDDPESALVDFERARALGVSDPLVNAANHSLALHRLGRNASALKVAAGAWPGGMTANNDGTMWDFRAVEPSLLTIDSQLYLAELGAEIAQDGADIASARTWNSRAEERRQFLREHNGS